MLRVVTIVTWYFKERSLLCRAMFSFVMHDTLCFQEFLRRHGSTSKLCRKVRSADNLPLASTNRQQDSRNSKDEGTEGDRESFLKANQEDKSEDLDSKRQSSIDSAPKDNTETSLLDPSHQQASSRYVIIF